MTASRTTRPARVLVVDDHPVILRLLRTVLGAHAPIEIVGEAADGRAAIALARSLEPDVVVMDLSLPEVDGLEACTAIRSSVPRCRIVVFSASEASRSEAMALAAGAHAYVEKDAGLEVLARAVVALAGLPA
jgi:DNA-binding NarL/FixJ family response regulator